MADLAVTPIVALDVDSGDDALALVEQLGSSCGFYKVGGELFTATGPQIVRRLRDLGHEVFLDLKFHDIPNTVLGSTRAAATMGATMLTVHASGGSAMLRAAVAGAGAGCRVMGVTVLTSLGAAAVGEAWGREQVDVGVEVSRLAGLVWAAGAHGVVCSGHEASLVRERFPGLQPLVPGIRFSEGEAHDQARVMTPARAASSGARYLVLGRAVTGAREPRAAMERVLAELG